MSFFEELKKLIEKYETEETAETETAETETTETEETETETATVLNTETVTREVVETASGEIVETEIRTFENENVTVTEENKTIRVNKDGEYYYV